MVVTKGKFKIIGICPNNSVKDFNQMQRELKDFYGYKKVWNDLNRENNTIEFITTIENSGTI